ncbi:MAG: hypothetical protein QM627_12650 [Luteolibacter sp.]
MRFHIDLPTLKKLFRLLFIALGCLHLVGGPYCLMQTVAWATMLVDYSRQDGLLEGAKNTFSGEKPCELCEKIQVAKQNDTKGKSPVAPLSSLSFKSLHELLPGEILALKPPFSANATPVTFTRFLLYPGIGPSSPPVPPPDHSVA